MSLTDYLPLLGEEEAEGFQAEQYSQEKANFGAKFLVKEILNPKPDASHIASVNLGASSSGFSAVNVSRNGLLIANARGFVDPSIAEASVMLKRICNIISSRYNDVVVRVFVSQVTDADVAALVDADCEVWIMEARVDELPWEGIWTLLPLAEDGKFVTLGDVNALDVLIEDLARSEMVRSIGLGGWRLPGFDHDFYGLVYCPLTRSRGGYGGGCDVIGLSFAFLKSLEAGYLQPPDHPFGGLLRCPARDFTDSRGLERWFLSTTMYPRFATASFLTIAPSSICSPLFTLDVEYATWANADSQLVFADDEVAGLKNLKTPSRPLSEIHGCQGKSSRNFQSEPLIIVRDLGLSGETRQGAVRLVNSIMKFAGRFKVIAFSNHSVPLMESLNASFSEHYIDLPRLDLSPGASLKLQGKLIALLDQILEVDPETWIIFAGNHSVALAELESIIPRESRGAYGLPNLEILWLENVKKRGLVTNSGDRDAMASPELWAVRRKYLATVATIWIDRCGLYLGDYHAFWSDLLQNLSLRHGCFPKGKVVALSLNAVDLDVKKLPAFVSFGGSTEGAVARFLNAFASNR